MTTVMNQSAPGGAARQAAGLPRLLPAAPEDLRAHLARYGPTPYRNQPGALIGDVEASGLTGRGGAAFPVHRKLAAVARAGVRQGRTVVVANGAESEPASRKDELLLQLAPNLVLDGLQLTAEAVGATEAHLYLHHAPGPQILRALAERNARGLDRLAVTITQAPPRFLAGQETAVVNRLGGGPALPIFQPPRVSERGLGGAPTLVQNVETLAHLALIARYGPRWFRAVGTGGRARLHAHHHLPPRRQGPRPRGGDRHAAEHPARRRTPTCRPGWSAATTAPGCRCRTRPGSPWTTRRCAGSAPPRARACWRRCRPTGAA